SWGADPMEGDTETSFITEGQQPTSGIAGLPLTLNYIVEPNYLKTMRIPLLRGRFVTDADNEHSPRAGVIDRAFAQKYFPGQDPIGKEVSVFDFDTDPTRRTWIPLTIVGVVGHVKQFGLADDGSRPLQAQLYQSLLQSSAVLLKHLAQGT